MSYDRFGRPVQIPINYTYRAGRGGGKERGKRRGGEVGRGGREGGRGGRFDPRRNDNCNFARLFTRVFEHLLDTVRALFALLEIARN